MRNLYSEGNLPLHICTFPFLLSYSHCIISLEQTLFPAVFVQHKVEQVLSMPDKYTVKYRCWLLSWHPPLGKCMPLF